MAKVCFSAARKASERIEKAGHEKAGKAKEKRRIIKLDEDGFDTAGGKKRKAIEEEQGEAKKTALERLEKMLQ